MPFSVKLPSVAANVLTLHLIDFYTFTHILHEHKFAVPHPSLTKFAEPKHIFFTLSNNMYFNWKYFVGCFIRTLSYSSTYNFLVILFLNEAVTCKTKCLFILCLYIRMVIRCLPLMDLKRRLSFDKKLLCHFVHNVKQF